MGVYIKNMKMPKNCLTCKLAGDGSDSKYIWDCPFTEFEYTREEGETGRLDECPLVEVPTPHGRLVDADALQCKVDDIGLGYYEVLGVTEDTVDDAPTVIEAEGSEDE